MKGMLRNLLPGLLIASLAGCSTATNVGSMNGPSRDDRNAAPSSFELNVLEDSFIDGASADGFTLSAQSHGEDILLSVDVANAEGLKAVYFELEYDAETFRPLHAQPTELMGDRDDIIALDVLGERGTLSYGQVLANYDWRAGYTGSGTVAQLLFRRTPTPVLRAAAAPPVAIQSRSEIRLVGNILEWDYANRGDYDQNGIPNISDLTPLGANFQTANDPPGPFDRASSLSVIDGDNNGIINISDLTPLGAAFGTVVTGYNVYGSLDAGDLPPDATTESDETLRLTNQVLNEAVNFADKTTERLQFQFDLGAADVNSYYWVRPYDTTQDNEGIAAVRAPAGVAPVVTPVDALAGSGTAGDPWIVDAGSTYAFTVTDPTNGNADVTAQSVLSSTLGSFTDATLTVPGSATAGTEFEVTAEFNSLTSDPVILRVSGTPAGGLFIMADTTGDTDWTLAPNYDAGDLDITTGLGSSADKAWILHDSTFNQNTDADDEYDEFDFTLKASETDDFAVLLDNETLEWAGFFPWIASGINDTGSKGTFQVNIWTGGGESVYVFAEDTESNQSNSVYIQAQELP